jgi:hypothetical protein
MEAWDIWPFPVVQHAACVDEELGGIIDYLVRL